MAIAAALGGLVSACAPAAAHAERYPVTRQAQTARAAFLAYAPAPAAVAALCLVDSGVSLNPDTQGPVVSRVALDNGTGEDTDPDRHGTLMAMVAAAPANDYGMVGAWPSLRIVSIRVRRPDGSFSIGDYTDATNRCTREAPQTGVKVVNLSLGSQGELETGSQEAIANAVDLARSRGLNVVAAAGNGGGALDSPASNPSTFAIGAVGSSGAFCAFSARGNGLDLSAPGCELNVALPSSGEPATAAGTSEASAFTAAVLAALRSYAPDLDPTAAEQLLQRTAQQTSAGLVLDVEAAFAAAGLQSVVDAGKARTPASTLPPASSSADSGSSTSSSDLAPTTGGRAPERAVAIGPMPAPRVRPSYRRGVLRLVQRQRPRGSVLRIEVYAPARNGLVVRKRVLRRSTTKIAFRLARWERIVLRLEDLYDFRENSRAVTIRHTRTYPPAT